MSPAREDMLSQTEDGALLQCFEEFKPTLVSLQVEKVVMGKMGNGWAT